MDLAAPVGIVLAFVVVIVSNILEGGDPMALVLVGPMLLVWGTTILVTIAGNTIPDVKMAMRSVGYAMTAKIRSSRLPARWRSSAIGSAPSIQDMSLPLAISMIAMPGAIGSGRSGAASEEPATIVLP